MSKKVSKKSAAAWKGLQHTAKGNATRLYNAVRKDAEQHDYTMSKEEAARIAKKYKKSGKTGRQDTANALESARRHHGVEVTKIQKTKK